MPPLVSRTLIVILLLSYLCLGQRKSGLIPFDEGIKKTLTHERMMNYPLQLNHFVIIFYSVLSMEHHFLVKEETKD